MQQKNKLPAMNPAWYRTRSFYLLTILVGYFITAASITDIHLGYLTGIVFTAIIIFGIYYLSNEQKTVMIAAGIAGIITISFFWADDLFRTSTIIQDAQYILASIFFILLIYVCLSQVIKTKAITVATLFTAVCIYLLIGLAWSNLYALLNHLSNSPFHFDHNYGYEVKRTKDFIYYSFVTLTTLGYGDITPITQLSQVFSWLEAVTGQMYLTILIAQLVGKYIVSQHKEQL
ncbi:MAG: two pore domain potassium channel family protein [Gammaproteobacteria bacterium]|nr:two pore domain potassium channel family protein [Gammaproteobacteria bacterium]